MTVLVTGSSGFIGTALCRLLLARGWNVVGVDMVRPRRRTDVTSFYQLDLHDSTSVKTAIQNVEPESIVHLAARTDLREERDLGGYSANTTCVRSLCEIIKATPSVSRTIFASSQLVCKVGYSPRDEYDYCPNTIYGLSKVEGERIVRSSLQDYRNWVITRPTTVWGPGMSEHYQSFLELISSGKYFHCSRSPLKKSYAYIDNIAYQYYRLIEVPAEMIHGKLFYLSDYIPLSLRDYANGLAEQFNAPRIRTLPLWAAKLLARGGDMLNTAGLSFPFNSFRLRNILTEYVFDTSRIKSVCGDLPVSQDEGIRRTARWYMDLKSQSNTSSSNNS